MYSRLNSATAIRLVPGVLLICALVLAAGSAAAAAPAPVLYVTGLNTTYTVLSTCLPTDFTCTTAQPISYAGRNAFVSELRKKGVQVVTTKPAQANAFRVTITLRNLETQERPSKDGYHEGMCEATGLLLGGRIPPRLSELDLRHKFRLAAANFGAGSHLTAEGMDNAVSMCMRRQAHWIAEIIKKYP